MAGYWSIVVPEVATNLVMNPSLKYDATGYNKLNGTEIAVTRLSVQSCWGAYAVYVETSPDTNREGFYYPASGASGIAVAASTAYTFSAWVSTYFSLIELEIWWYNAGGSHLSTDVQAIGNTASKLVRQTMTVTSPATAAFATLVIAEIVGSATPISWYVDGMQFEQAGYATTYCDGDQPGCEWLGKPHASQSRRSAQSRAGGRIYSLQDQYSFYVEKLAGEGMAPIQRSIGRHAILPGGVNRGHKAESRPFSLIGSFVGTSMSDLHSKRLALEDVVKPDLVPGDQPVRLRYTGAAVEKEIVAYYESGLDMSLDAPTGWNEELAVRFMATDPFFYEIAESATPLDTGDTATLRYIAGRLRGTGQWDALGPPSAVTDPGSGIDVYALAEDATYVYIGGYFLNWDGIANADYLVKYNKSTGVYSAIAALNDVVHDMVVKANGLLVFCGAFTNAGGDANADYVATYDPDTGTVAAVGGGLTDICYSVALHHNVSLGNDTVVVADGSPTVHYWNGAAWVDLSAAGFSSIQGIAFDRGGNNLYVAGFTGVFPADTIMLKKWDGTAWTTLVSGDSYNIQDVLVRRNGDVVFVGNFGTVAGVTCNGIGVYSGGAVQSLGEGVLDGSGAGIVYAVYEADDGTIWIVGDFDRSGAGYADTVAWWNGSVWVRSDLVPPASSAPKAILVSPADPVLPGLHDVYIGFDTTGTAYLGGTAMASNDGKRSAYPRIEVKRTGGTSARLYQVRNETLDRALLFEYDLMDGEELIISLAPSERHVESNFWGQRADAILPNSDEGQFVLQPGSNQITCFVQTTGSPTVTVDLIWKDTYWSAD